MADLTTTITLTLTLASGEDGFTFDAALREIAEDLVNTLFEDFGHPDPMTFDPDAQRADGYPGPFVVTARADVADIRVPVTFQIDRGTKEA